MALITYRHVNAIVVSLVVLLVLFVLSVYCSLFELININQST